MKKIESSIIINQSVEKVWSELMNFEDYPQWNPFIRQINGNSKVNGFLEIHLDIGREKQSVFKPEVIVNNMAREFRWLGRLWTKGIFDGEHFFILKSLDDNRTQLFHGEHFSGLLSGLIFKMIQESTQKGFEAMNTALKNRLEERAN